MIENKKIVVIADDFTGAAEIGGIGLRHDLNVAIETEPIYNKDIDLLVIATDTRSMAKEEASACITHITKQVLKFNPMFIYKKIDSALRGNILDELTAQMKIMDKNRSVIIAANPELKRIIKDGKYYVDNIPLNKTRFSIDSQYPIKTNDVIKVLSPFADSAIINLKSSDPLPDKGIILGDVENADDLLNWALKFDEKTLFAGASGFFNSLLLALRCSKQQSKNTIIPFGNPALFVLGSSYPKDKETLAKMIEYGHYHSNMPEEIYYNKKYDPVLLDKWVEDVITGIQKHGKVIVSSIHTKSKENGISIRVKKIMTELVRKLFERTSFNEILIEGGSTTSEILDQLNIKKLTPIQELDTGVIRMRVDKIPNLCLTTKPGSYQWPENVWMKEKIDKNKRQSLLNIKIHE
ncbi:hypothetical protein ES703_92410 [subsurface metagenome]